MEMYENLPEIVSIYYLSIYITLITVSDNYTKV